MADHLNGFFASAAKQALQNSKQTSLKLSTTCEGDHPMEHLTHFLPTNKNEVTKTLSSLKSKPSAGIDEISSALLKHCINEVTTPIVDVINKSFRQGTFPSSLNQAVIFPKLKKGSTNQATNYRPISLICTVSKIYKKIVLRRLLSHLKDNHLITERQHGFRKGKSTITALVDLVEIILDASETGATTTGVLLDFSKAFDSLSHQHLLDKLKTLGIRGKALQWLQSYLNGRTQMTELTHITDNNVTKTRSSKLPTTRGVPQGSVLGPVLFILYTNDIVSVLRNYCEPFLFADDTALIVSHRNPEALEINTYIAANIAKQYSQENDLVLNEEKTQQLFFGPGRANVQELPFVQATEEAKYLGIMLDSDLNWKPQIEQLCKKLSTALYVIKRLTHISGYETAKIAYHALFESHIRYGLIVWGYSSQGNLQRVLVLQKKAIRALSGLGFRESCRGRFKNLKIQTVANLYISEAVMHVIKKGPLQFSETHSYNTRNKVNYSLPAHHLKAYEKKPSYIGAKLFNKLPNSLKTLTNEKNFKTRLLEWLMENKFYSVEEFLELNEMPP